MRKLKHIPEWWSAPETHTDVTHWEDYELEYEGDAHAGLTYDVVNGKDKYSLVVNVGNAEGQCETIFYKLTAAEFVAFRLEGAVFHSKKGDY